MPLMHCMECHHEWESSSDKSLCDWCGEAGYVLKDKTDLEKMLDIMQRRGMKNGLPWWHQASFVMTPADPVARKNTRR